MGERGGSTLALTAWEEKGLLQQPLNTQRLTGTGHAFSMPNQPPTSSPARQDHSLSLSPGDGIHTRVGQEVRAVPDLHVGDPFLCFCFHKLVGNSPHRLTVTPAGMAVGPVTLRAHRAPPRLSQGILPRVEGEAAKSRVLTQWQACSSQISLETGEVSVVCHS